MTLNELSSKLFEMYTNAPHGEAVAHIHLFGIRYGKEILKNNYKPQDIIKYSKLKESYLTELMKGMKLSKYVTY